MAPEPSRAPVRTTLCLAALTLLFATAPAHALRIVNYNITNYPNVAFAQRQPHFRTIVAPLNADVFVCQEVTSQAGVDSFRTNVLNAIEPGQWASAPFTNGNDTDNALFYKPAKVTLLGTWAFYPNPADPVRLINVYRLRPVGYSSDQAELRLYSLHLKASSGSANETRRLGEATGLRDSLNAMPPGTHAIVCGDYNIYRSSEPAFQKLLESQGNNTGQLHDVLNAIGTWNNAGFATIHTQCPCLTCPTGTGFSGGGLDDRFDIFLPSSAFGSGEGLDMIPGTYIPVGNDGNHYNLNITDAPTIPEGSGYATALWNASDHLPVRLDLQVPAKATAPATLAFGSLITGAPAQLTLAVTNPALPPADELTYTLSASAGLTVPGGTLTVLAGLASSDPVTLNTGTPGAYGGNIVVNSDAPDSPALNVAVTATVLRHADASLDSATTVHAGALDFGTHALGRFTTLGVRVHNHAYDALQAQLALQSGAITGGDGRFSIVGGFSPSQLAGLGRTFEVAFADTGATIDSTYQATLTFGSSDEPLPGAAAQPALVVALQARRTGGGSVGVDGTAAPAFTRLYAPVPNPLTAQSQIAFDLARPADVKLEAFDLSGRRVATLVSRGLEAGRYHVSFAGRGDDGAPLGSGLYFLRLSVPGAVTQNARLVVVR